MGLHTDFVAKLRAVADALEALDGPAIPAPEWMSQIPAGFDEKFYLTKYTDVADAVKAGYFVSGAHHYVTNGRAENRAISASVQPPPPIPVPLPVPPTAWEPAERYTSVSNFREVLSAHTDFSYGINLDNKDAFEDGKGRFGPAMNYYTWPDGSVRQGTAPEGMLPTRRPGDALLASYKSIDALQEDVRLVNWSWAVLLDGEPVVGGFKATPPAEYVTRNGRLEKV
jgi:hypothetical protein